MFNVEKIEELKNYFLSTPESGIVLPNPKDVPDWTTFYLLTDGVYIEHVMFKNSWHKKVIDANSNLVLSKV